MTTVTPFEELPLRVREDVARARNARVRMESHRQAMLGESAVLKTHIRLLNTKHNLNPSRIAALLDMSRARVLTILGKR